MKRTVHNLVQGSPEWDAYRANPKQCNASDTPAMLGVSKYKSRDALLKEKATGVTPEVDAHTQRIFDQGHEFESMARPIAIEIIGEEIYPAIMSVEIDGLLLSASLDGINMDDSIAWEHKTLNQAIQDSIGSGEIPEIYRAQMEHQLLVSGAERCLFMASRGTADTEVHAWYESDPVLRAQIIAGWHQFKKDLENYVAPEAEAQKAIAEPVETLPAITYSTDFKATGLELRSNIDAFKAAAQRLVEQSKNVLESDQDFANAEARIKSCKAAEEKIAVIQSNVVGEVSDIDKFVKDLGAISEMLRQCRLNEDKQVRARKEAIKVEELTRASNEWNAVIVGYNEQLWKIGKVQMPVVRVDFQGAIKGLKTVASLRSKLNDEIARGKIEAAKVFEGIKNNIQLLHMIAGEYMELFADLQTICIKDADYIKAIAKQRVDEHKAAEQARIKAEAQRIANEQIEADRKAEAEKAQAEQQRIASEQLERDSFNKEQMEKRAAAETQNNATEKQEVQLDLVGSIPAEYEQYASAAPSFEKSFNEVFSDAPDPVPMVDLGDFHAGYVKGEAAGIIKGLDLALAIFMKQGAAGFAKAVEDFIEVGAEQAAQAEAA